MEMRELLTSARANSSWSKVELLKANSKPISRSFDSHISKAPGAFNAVSTNAYL
ncbi:hypothetical protein [Intestinibacillus massiliensis]|uniref:hypothetical protein n=1 Tax=Intestinibacillus massiliensis TaxID=1871029 RepID=UPI001A9A2FA8|nr:hypothetical protein [Intestinibacillus massiliensis]